MTLGAADTAFVRDLFGDLPDFATRRMFGGMGIYAEGVIFALMRSDGTLLIKAQDDDFIDRLTAMGATRWTYTRKSGASAAMPYWTFPEALLDDPEAALSLAREALHRLC